MMKRLSTWTRRHINALSVAMVSLSLMLMSSPALAAGELDDAIEGGFGKLVKYGRWTAALALAVFFVLAWAKRAQNGENPHEQQSATRQMIWTGVGFVAVIGYQLILTGLVEWFGIDRNAIPTFLWQ